jgi:hypothetical protein
LFSTFLDSTLHHALSSHFSQVKFVDEELIKEEMESGVTKVGKDSELEFLELTQLAEMREAEYSAERGI